MKHDAFVEEREWRMYIRRNDRDVSNISFVARSSAISGYIHLPLFAPGFPVTLPLQEVLVGPSRNQALSCAAIDALLIQKNHAGVRAAPSRIPLRSL